MACPSASWRSVAVRSRACRKLQERERACQGGGKETALLTEARGTKLRESPDAGPSPPPDHVEFIQEFVDAGVVVITFCHHQVKGPAVLGTDLLHQVVGHFLSLQEGKRGQRRRNCSPGRAESLPGLRD